jgi:phospholipid/cholesterol/gamma-HCH transport system substrate-binding protein
MSEQTSYLKTGISVSFGVALLLASILFFGGDRTFFTSYNTYKIKFDSTQGLNIGSVVSLSGMEVGNITKINFNSENSLIVDIKIDKKYGDVVTTMTRASIRTQGALGDKYIYLEPGAKGGTVLQPTGEILVDHKPDLIDMISGKGDEFSSFQEILAELSVLLKNLNANNNSAQLMKNAVLSSEAMSKLLADPNIKTSFAHLKNILKKIDNGQGTMGQLVNDPSLHEHLVRLLGESPRNSYLKPLLREAIKQNEVQKKR